MSADAEEWREVFARVEEVAFSGEGEVRLAEGCRYYAKVEFVVD